MNFIKNNKISILLTAFTLFFIYTQLEIKDGCKGMITAIWGLFFLFVYAVILVFYFSKAIWYYIEHKQKINFSPLYLTILFLLLFFLKISIHVNPFSSKIVFQASMHDNCGKSITLYQNKKFRIDKREACYSCYNIGKYQWNNDTLVLNRNDIYIRNYNIPDKYLLSKDSRYLIPIDSDMTDSAFWFISDALR